MVIFELVLKCRQSHVLSFYLNFDFIQIITFLFLKENVVLPCSIMVCVFCCNYVDSWLKVDTFTCDCVELSFVSYRVK